MPRLEFFKKYDGLTYEDELTPGNVRGTDVVKFTKRVSTATIREMLDAVNAIEGCALVSIGAFLKYKPFFVVPPSEREKESCLCKFCLNTRLLFRPLLKHLKPDVHKTNSLTAYFGDSITCSPGENGFFKEVCIREDCKSESCSQQPKYGLGDLSIEPQGSVEFYQFVTEVTNYVKRDGKLKESKRTIGKNSLRTNF